MCRTVSERTSVRVRPIFGLSTPDESFDAAKCPAEVEGSRILTVTSDFHMGCALSVFCNEPHGKTFSIAPAHDIRQFRTRWWTHRQWAKTCADDD